MQTCLVTGGAGFIGSHITEALVARGDRVRIMDNLSTGKMRNLIGIRDKIDFVKGDIVDYAAVQQAVKGVDVIFHQAALASVPRSIEAPLDTHHACVTGTLNLLDAARRAGIKRFVYAASSSAYGDLPHSPKCEGDLPLPISPYGTAKLAGEYYCRAFAKSYGMETVCIRYFNVFGPRQDPDSPYSAVIPLFIAAMLSGRRPVIYGDGLQSRDFTFVSEVVRGNLLAASAPNVAGQVFNVACGGSITLLELIERLNEMLGTRIQPQHEPARVGDVRESKADITAARQYLGFEPQVPFEEGLRKSIEYYRQLISERAGAETVRL